MRIYISGPMSGIAEHNFPAFEAAAISLRALGHFVISPHETEEVDYSASKSWEYYLRKDLIAMLTDCDHIVLLPGWERSKGATLELHVAAILGFIVIDFVDGNLVPWRS